MKRARTAGILLALVACSTSPARETEATGTTVASIQGGVADTVDTFAVGVCRNVGKTPGHCIEYCSGALVLPNVVATARHCVSASPETVDCSTAPTFGALGTGPLWITTSATMDPTTGNAGWYAVKTVHLPGDDHICGHDIALLELETVVPESVARPVIPGVQYSIWDPAQYGASFAAIGYGNQSTASNDGVGTRRKLDYVSVLCVPGSNVVCAPPFDDGEFAGGDGICAGDSGSSAFERRSYDRGAPVSLGVLSRGGASGTQCVGSIYTRFDTQRDFVLQVARTASAGWTLYPEPSWTAPKPAAVPTPRDAGATVVDASVPDASTCSDGACGTDAGSPPTTASGDGGGCSMTHGNASSFSGLLGIAALLAVRRRRGHT